MGNFAHSPIHKKRSQSSSLRSLSQIWIFICSISRLYGVHTENRIMKGMYAFMPIIGKIFEGNLRFFPIRKKCAPIGPQRNVLLHIQLGVNWSTGVSSAMVGRNRNFIQSFLRSNPASMDKDAVNLIARTFIISQIKETYFRHSLNIFLNQEIPVLLPIIIFPKLNNFSSSV